MKFTIFDWVIMPTIQSQDANTIENLIYENIWRAVNDGTWVGFAPHNEIMRITNDAFKDD